jgi:ribonucleotide monophosphatase NagD (HAD superfamily)
MQQKNRLVDPRRHLRRPRIVLDLDGVVYVRDTLLPGSLDTISKIEAAGIRLKFISNTTRCPRVALLRISG